MFDYEGGDQPIVCQKPVLQLLDQFQRPSIDNRCPFLYSAHLHLFNHNTSVNTTIQKFVPSGKLNLFCTTDVNSRILRPFSPRTCCVRVARIMISVRVGVTLTSTPLYPSSASSRRRNSFNSALKTPSATNYIHII
ncbi:UNVERIFIED_CONTAM: hypothetical protein NCL1_53689 [Trichonephila clavipes]